MPYGSYILREVKIELSKMKEKLEIICIPTFLESLITSITICHFSSPHFYDVWKKNTAVRTDLKVKLITEHLLHDSTPVYYIAAVANVQ